jgi:hypothetical protein
MATDASVKGILSLLDPERGASIAAQLEQVRPAVDPDRMLAPVTTLTDCRRALSVMSDLELQCVAAAWSVDVRGESRERMVEVLCAEAARSWPGRTSG